MPLEFWYIGTDGHCARHFGSLLHAELHVFPDVEDALGNNSKGPVIALWEGHSPDDDLDAIEEELENAEAEDSTEEAAPEKDYGFLAVCAGDGLAGVFTDLGADGVISGGQTMNPSTESILKEIRKVPAHTVFVLPNNKNIIMAAQAAAELASREVVVIPTKTVPQGISAMMAVDPDAESAEVIEKAMTDAAQCVATAQITYAARNSDFDGFDIPGETISPCWTASFSALTATFPPCLRTSPTWPPSATRNSSPFSTART